MTAPSETECPGCGLVLPTTDGPIDPYGNSSPACWAVFGEIMAREFSGPEFFACHRLTVDAYMVQHQVQTTRASRQSLWVHLAGLKPPAGRLSLTVVHLRDAAELNVHARRAREWAAAVWEHWGEHHGAIESMVQDCEHVS